MSQDYSHVRAELLSLMLKFWLSPNAGAWERMSNFLSRSISFSGPRCQWKRILSVLSSQDKEERRKWPTGRPLAEASAVEEISLDGVYCDSVTQHSLLQNHVPISLACFTNISGNCVLGGSSSLPHHLFPSPLSLPFSPFYACYAITPTYFIIIVNLDCLWFVTWCSCDELELCSCCLSGRLYFFVRYFHSLSRKHGLVSINKFIQHSTPYFPQEYCPLLISRHPTRVDFIQICLQSSVSTMSTD